jgi:presenilin-like A22 family membrane protease
MYCYDHPPDDRITPKTPLYAGSVMAGLSIGLLIGGGVKLASVPHAFRNQHRGGDRMTYLALGAVAGALVGSVVLGVTHLADRMACIDP